MLCDFCSDAPSIKSFPCRDFVLPEFTYRSAGEFHACIICSWLIEHDEWVKLENLSVQTYQMNHPHHDAAKTRAFVRALQAGFRENRI